MKKLMLTSIFFISILLLLSPIPKITPAAEKEIILKLGTHWPIPHLMTSVMESWMKDIEARTKGRVKIRYFPADQMLSLKDALEKVSLRVCEMGDLNPEYYPARLPLVGGIGLPFLFSSSIQGTKVMNELLDFFRPEFEANNLKLLWGFTPPPYQVFTSTKPIYTLEDWKGLRLRSVGGTQAEGVKAMGGIPVVIHTGEYYTALQRGTIDGGVHPLSAASAFKLQEVSKYVVKVGLSTCGMSLIINLDTWRSLPQDIQNEILEANAVAAERAAFVYHEEETRAFDVWEKAGVKIFTPPEAEFVKWRKKVEPVWSKWISEQEAKRLPAKKITEEMINRARKYE